MFHDVAGQEEFKQMRSIAYDDCDPNRTIILFCYSAESKTTLENIDSYWLDEVDAVSRHFTKVLVRLKEDLYNPKKENHVTMEDGEEIKEKFGMHFHVSCDSLKYCLTNGQKGNVETVFSGAIQAHIDRNLAQELKWPCDC